MLLVHGFPFSSRLWAEQLARPPEGWRLIAPDLPGFGESPPPAAAVDAYSMDLFADVLAALLDEKGIGKAVVCGLSMGGYIALALWRRHRDRVAALVLADTRAETDDAAARAARASSTAGVRARGSVAEAVESMLPRLLSAATLRDRPGVVKRLRGMMETTPVETFARAQTGMAVRPDSTGLLPAIDVPALVVVGAEDGITPPAAARAMAAAIPGAALRVIPAAGHVTPPEVPAAFGAALSGFLEGLRPRRPPGR